MTKEELDAAPGALTILPIGGAGEVGLNSTLFVYDRQALLLDCGAFLGVENAPGVNKVVPGFEPVFRGGRRLAGVILTHGHEDHIGALPALLAERDVPIFATPLTCDFVRSRLERDEVVPSEARAQARRLVEVPAGGRFEVGPFSVELVRVTHSVPGSVAVVIDCPAGRVLHTGDFRLDPGPWDGKTTDLERLRALGQGGVDLLMSDSTNAEIPGRGCTEREVAGELERQIQRTPGRVVVTLMASHLHRMAAIAEIARRMGRRLCIVGRTMERNWAIGVGRGLLPSDPHLLMLPDRLADHPRSDAIVLATGSQGEWNGGLTRIAAGQDALLKLYPGDKVIFSARTIPGNEVPVRRIVNQLARQGVEVVGPERAPVHASGHARQEEQRELIELVEPGWFVPAYGERAMLEAHARTAREAGIPAGRVLVVENGQSLVLREGALTPGPREEVSRRPLDEEGRVMDWGDVRDRNRIGRGGLVACSVALDRSGRLAAPPVLTGRGLSIPPALESRLLEAVRAALDDPHLISRSLIEDAARAAILATFGLGTRRGPQVEVLVVALDRHLAS